MSNRINRILMTLLLVILSLNLLSGKCLGQSGSSADPRPAGTSEPTGERAGVASLSAAEDLRNKLERSYPLLPEGVQIRDRSAKLIKHPTDARWFLVFKGPDAPASKPQPITAGPVPDPRPVAEAAAGKTALDSYNWPIEVLPGKWLATITNISDNKTNLSIIFRVLWAEITTYHGRNYILPSLMATESLFGAVASAEATQKPKRLSTLDSRLTSSAIAKAVEPTEGDETDSGKLPGRLRELLMSLPRVQPMPLTETDDDAQHIDSKEVSEAKGGPVATRGSSTGAAWPDGYMVIDRVGRPAFDPEERRYAFAFEADGESLAEPPVVIQPSRLLEVTENAMRNSGRRDKFRISGEVSRYQGRNYILLRKFQLLLFQYQAHKCSPDILEFYGFLQHHSQNNNFLNNFHFRSQNHHYILVVQVDKLHHYIQKHNVQ